MSPRKPRKHYTAQEKVAIVRRHLIEMMASNGAVPDLTVEVLSRSTARRDRGRKMEMYARYGVPEYWIVDPVANTLEIYLLAAGAYDLAAKCDADAEVLSPTLRGLSFAAGRIFEE